jgi:heat shock protein HtpX
MVDTSLPVLVYNRIDVNRRNTRLLLAVFAALLLPFTYVLAQFLPIAYGIARILIVALLLPGEVVFPKNTGTAIVSWTTIAMLAFVFALGFAYAGNALISSYLLRRAHARRVYRDKEPDLFRTVENLCIGAGLPPPTLYIVESTEPNVFTTGCDPEHASLVVNRGLLHLLDKREVAAVVAHELSHIGNHDTDCSTVLAALVATVSLPVRVVTEMARLISFWFQEPAGIAVAGLVVFPLIFLLIMASGLNPAGAWLVDGDLNDMFGTGNLETIVATSIYALVLGPWCAALLRGTMSQQRDFLADADAALLTRDPKGLALALAKIGGAIRFSQNADAAAAHLHFVDTLSRTSWWDVCPSHPPIEARIALLARMGDGIPEAELRDAAAAAEKFRHNPSMCEPGSRARLTGARTLLYKEASEFSTVLADLDANVLVTIPGPLFRPAGTQFRLTGQLTPLYAKPDGSSQVVQQISSGTVVTIYELVGSFARVATEHAVGYIPRAAAENTSPK